jgi:hypothetical protein
MSRLARTIRHVAAIAARELLAAFTSPIAWVVLVLFLVVQGFSFWAVLEVLADPRAPQPYGAVLRTHFGGNFLYWTFLFFVVSAIAMRLVAEERRQGTWEALLTTPVGEGRVIAGKWLGALAFYAFLWLPTLAFVVILAASAPAGASPDPGPVLAAYLGVVLMGTSFLAVGLCASAATGNQIVACVLSFVGLMVLLLVGLAPEVSPAFFARHGVLRAVALAIDPRRQMDDFARGIIDSRHVVFHLALAGAALAAAGQAARAGRRPRLEAVRGAVGIALIAAGALLVIVLSHRHPMRVDVTRARVYAIESKTRAILGDVRRPVGVLVVRGGGPAWSRLYDEIDEVLRQLQAVQPLLSIETVDPALEPERAERLAEDHALPPRELAQEGAVVFRSGTRSRAVSLRDMADLDEAGAVTALRAEAALASAVLDVTDAERPAICFVTGHGEPDLDMVEGGRDLALLVEALRRDGTEPRAVTLAGGVPAGCRLLALVGPRRPLAASEARLVDGWLAGGGRMIVAVDAETTPARDAFVPTGLEAVLPRHGVKVAAAVVVDPAFEVGVPLSWGTVDGYGEHAVSASLSGRRLTIWRAPRLVQAVDAEGVRAEELVSSSPTGWAETDLAGLFGPAAEGADEKDLPGPAAIAVAAERAQSGMRLVVLGSARSFTSDTLQAVAGASNDALFTSAVAWATGRMKLVGVDAKTPERFRLVMTADQVTRLFWILVLGLPGLAASAGVAVAWRRRRGA